MLRPASYLLPASPQYLLQVNGTGLRHGGMGRHLGDGIGLHLEELHGHAEEPPTHGVVAAPDPGNACAAAAETVIHRDKVYKPSARSFPPCTCQLIYLSGEGWQLQLLQTFAGCPCSECWQGESAAADLARWE